MSEAEGPAKAGRRPTKYQGGYRQRVVEFMAEGFSLAAFAGEIGVAYSTVRRWEAEHPDFGAAVKEGRAKAVLWWERRVRAIALGEGGNMTAVIFGLKNRAPEEWRDKAEAELRGPGGAPLAALQVTFVRPGES